jgi:hypothetical protein
MLGGTHPPRDSSTSPEHVDPATIDLDDERFSPARPDTAVLVGWGLSHLSRAHAALLQGWRRGR